MYRTNSVGSIDPWGRRLQSSSIKGLYSECVKSNKENIESIDEKPKSGVYCNLNHSLLDDPILKLSD